MTLVKNKLAVAVAIALSTSFGLVGCGDDKSVSTAVGVPNPNTLMPTGTVQGVLRDSVTNEPIVGAIVDIGIAQAVTSETGQFIIKDVPATKATGAANAGGNDPYRVTIDLRNVKQAAGAAKYPSFSFATAEVTYSSLNDGSNDAGTSSSNHDTPVTGLTAPLTLTVGKLAAGIKGTVVKETDLKAVGAGYIVKLVSVSNAQTTTGPIGLPNPNSTTGAAGDPEKVVDGKVVDRKFLDGNVVATATTDASGAFSFSGIESLHDFRIEVVNADGTEYGVEAVKSPADGQVKTLLAQRASDKDIQDLRTVFVASTDTLAPKLVKTTPETGTERAPGANVTVTFSFSEPIVSNGLTNSLTAPTPAKEGLYDLVSVNFTGIKDIAMKASNIPYSLAWDATRTQLTVIIPKVKASANYEVSIFGAKGILKDNNQEPLNLADGEGVVKFSTSATGTTKPAKVEILAINNNDDLNQTNNAVIDWLPVAGAKGYHVYRAKFVNDVMVGTYMPIERTKNDADTAKAAAQSYQNIANAAKAAVAQAKADAATKATDAATKATEANKADTEANTAVKAAAPTLDKVVSSTDATAKLTVPAAADANALDTAVKTANTAMTSTATEAATVNTTSSQATNSKVTAFNNAAAAAAAVSIDTSKIKSVNTTAIQAAKVSAKVVAAAKEIGDIALAVARVDAVAITQATINHNAAVAAVAAATANVASATTAKNAAQATYDASKTKANEQILNNAIAALNTAIAAETNANIAKDKALAALNTANGVVNDAANKALADANAAKQAADDALNNPVTGAKKLAADADDALNNPVTGAKKAFADAKKLADDAQKAVDSLSSAATAEELAAAVKDLNAAKTALGNTRALAATAAAKAAAAAAAEDAAEAKKDTADEMAAKAAAAVKALQDAVNVADAALEAMNIATANLTAAAVKPAVLNQYTSIAVTQRAKIAAALAKVTAANALLVVSAADAEAAQKAAAAAVKEAAKAETTAKDVAAKALAAQTAVQVHATKAAQAAKDAAAAQKAAEDAITPAKNARDTAQAELDKVLTGTDSLAARQAAANKAAADLVTAKAGGKADEIAKATTADANAKAAVTAHPDDVKKKEFILAKAQAVLDNANAAVQPAKDAKTLADANKKAADDALVAINKAKAEADKAVTSATATKAAADKLLASTNTAATSIKGTAADAQAAKDTTTTAQTKSQTAADKADDSGAAAIDKVIADKNLVSKIAAQVAADKNLADAQGAFDSDSGYTEAGDTLGDKYLTQNTNFVESSGTFVEGVRKVTYKYKVRAVSEDNVESDDSIEIEAKDNTKPKVDTITMNTASNVVTVVFNEPINEIDFRTQANYVLSAPANSGITLPALSNSLFKPDNKTVVLTYMANIPAGSIVTVSGVKDLAGNVLSEVGNKATVDKVTSSIAGFVGSTQVTVFFSADMNKASAETAANYVLSSGPALLAENGVVYNAADNSVTLTYVSAIPFGATLNVSGVKDANGTVVESNTKAFN